MIRTILIDDEPLARDIVKFYLSEHKEIEIVAECCDGFEGLKAITQHKPDLIFLDIQMPKISGFEMLELVEDKPAVIFTTAFDEYAIKAFEVNAVDYLLKPIDKARFDAAIKKLPLRAPVINQLQASSVVTVPVVSHPSLVAIQPIAVTNVKPASALLPAKKLKVVHINELGESIPDTYPMVRMEDTRTTRLRFINQEIFSNAGSGAMGSGFNIFKSKNTPTN